MPRDKTFEQCDFCRKVFTDDVLRREDFFYYAFYEEGNSSRLVQYCRVCFKAYANDFEAILDNYATKVGPKGITVTGREMFDNPKEIEREYGTWLFCDHDVIWNHIQEVKEFGPHELTYKVSRDNRQAKWGVIPLYPNETSGPFKSRYR